MTVEQFGKALVASNLMTADDVKAFWSAIPADARPKTDADFGKLLVEKSLLTPFQVAELIAGRGSRLIMGDYTIVAQIGAGGMGQVYRARHRRMKRTVALKVMSNAAMQDEAAVKRFQREVHAAAKLEHPNIVTAYDSGESGNVKYLVMQFVDGGDLSDLVKKGGRLPVEQAVGYVIQAARGLAFAHGEGVIHRDIKPANLLLDKKGVVKILDMGLARFEDGGDGLTATEQVMGTVDYMSPEQAANTKGCDGRADIYSLGCTLWFLLTGKKLYEADTLIARLMLHRDGPLPSLVKERDDAPWPLEQALHKMIAKRVQDRFQSMDEAIGALAPFGGSAAGGSSSGSSPSVSQNADLASFMQAMGTGGGTKTNVSATQVKSATSANVDATAQFTSPEVGTDPKSQVLPKSATTTKTQSAKAKTKSGGNKTTLIAAGALGAVLLLAGIIVKIRDKGGNVVAEVNAPTGTSAEVITTPKPIAPAVPVTPATSTLTIGQIFDSPAYEWTTPENLGPPVNGPRQQDLLSLTNDQLRLYFRRRGGPDGNQDELCEVVRSSLTSPFGEPRVIGKQGSEGFVSGDGLTCVHAAADVYIYRRRSLDESFGAAENLGPQINSSTWERNPTLSPNGLTLFYSSDRNPQERKPLWISRRKSRDESFGPAENWGSPANTPDHILKALQLGDDRSILLWLRNNRWYRTFTNTSGITGVMPLSDSPFHDTPHVWIAPDGKTAYFSADRPGGLGNTDIYVTRLVPKNSATPNSPSLVSPATSNLTAAQLLESPDYIWTTPENLGPSINGPGHQDLSSLTSDQTRLYFNRKAADGKTDELCEVIRSSISSPFGEPKLVTVSASDAFVSHDGLSLYSGSPDISVRQRAVLDIPFGAAGKIDAISSSSTENHPTLSPDGLTLIFNSGRDQNAEKSNLYISQRRSPGEPFGPPSKLGPAVNTTSYEHKGFMLADRRTIVFVRDAWYMTTTRSDGKQVALTLPTHSFGQTTFLWLAPDGRTAYFSADLPGGLGGRDIYLTRRVPKSGGAPSVPSFVASVSPSFAPPATPATPPPPGDYALHFVQQNKVEAPNPQLDESQPFTVEAYITPGDADPNNRLIGVRLFGIDAEFHFEIKDSRWRFYSTHNEALSPEQFKPRRRVHVAGVRTTTGRLLYLDGKLVASKDDPLRLASKESETPLLLQAHGAIEFTFDEIRISQGIVYDKEFVPPPKLTADANTLALYHFDEGFGDVLKDSSGKGRDGKIIGATWVKADGSPIPASATPTTPAAATAIPAEALTFAGHRYLLADSFSTWSEAKAKAEALGGHLATVNSKEERDWILSNVFQKRPTLAQAGERPMQMRLGGLINGTGGRWTWITGEPFDESLWLGRTPTVVETCGLIWLADGQWTNVPTDDANARGHYFLVEWDTLGPAIASAAAPAGRASLPTLPPPAVFPFDAATALKHQEAWAAYLGVPIEFTNGVGMKFRLIPPGEFSMGLGPEFTDEELRRLTFTRDDRRINRFKEARPAHPVRITQPFYIEVEEVSVGRYRDVVGQLRAEMDQDPNAVLTHWVTWTDAIAFCNRLSEREGKRPAYLIKGAQITPIDDADGYRLPTEAQWEYACRAGTNTLWYFGNDGGRGGIIELRERYASPNPFGLTGLYGGANEWCWDATDLKPYLAATPGPSDDPREDVGTSRIKRGGSGDDGGGGDRDVINSFARSNGPASQPSKYSGFGRVVLPIVLPAKPPLPSEPRASVTGPAATPAAVSIPPGESPGAKSTNAAPRWPLAPSKPEEIAWLKSLNARLVLRNGTAGDLAVPFNGAVPPGSWTVVGIEFHRDSGPSLDDQALGRIAALADLEILRGDLAPPGTKVTREGFQQLKSLVHLRELQLGRFAPADSDPTILASFRQLETLKLMNMQLVGWEPHVPPGLRELMLYNTDDAKLDQLGVRPQIRDVRFAGYQNNHPVRLAATKAFAAANPWCRITYVGLDGDNMKQLVVEPTAPPPASAAAPNVEDPAAVAKWLLDNKKLAKIRFEIDGRTQMLSTVPTGPFKVVELNFSKNNNAGQSLSEEEVARLAVFTDLESLELSTLTDAGLAKLAPLKKLKSLIVPNNTLTPAAVATIRQFPQLEQLQASGDDEWLKPLAGMPTLRSMIFWKVNVSPQAMSWFPQYPNLNQLRLNDCFEAPGVRLSVALAPLKDCKNLKKLFLNTSKFDADALAVLSGLTGLTELDLYQSNVSEAQLKQLAAALPRCQIKWRDAANNFKEHIFEPTVPPKS